MGEIRDHRPCSRQVVDYVLSGSFLAGVNIDPFANRGCRFPPERDEIVLPSRRLSTEAPTTPIDRPLRNDLLDCVF